MFPEDSNPDARAVGSGSQYPGDVNVLLCNRSVHCMNESTHVATWRAMGSIANGKVIKIPRGSVVG